ncbi:MAG: hypothetical protein GY716_13750, partial [bacterium]|nr:hypothetical protein [bacterium]
MRRHVCSSASSDCHRIEFPDGEIHEFHEFHDFSAIPDEPDWRVTRITDVFAHDHYVEIDYSVADEWTITDSYGRTQTIHFTGGVVTSVELSAFGDETATYTLVHTPTEIERQKYGPPDCLDGSDPLALITVPLLARLVLPDESYYEMSYNTNDSSPGVLSGGIKKLRLPTGGELHWDYQQLDFLAQEPDLNFDGRVNAAYAVETKEIFVDSETQVGQ